MTKVAIIGAGSLVFTKQFLNDMFNTPCMAGTTYMLMGPTMWKLEKMKQYADQLIDKNGIDAKIECTTDRREALKGADFVICTFLIGGNDAYKYDIEIPLKYGVDQCIGDSLGPGGVFRMLRTAPVIAELGREIDELCPNAYILNYVNPMGAVCTTFAKCTKAQVVGLCHGVQTTLDLISGYTNVPKDEIDYVNAGINHMDWFLKLEHKGRDLYPLLKENMEKPEYYKNEKVRGELMRHCGYFMTESSGHLSEYIPWFRSSREALDTYCDEPMFGGETGAALKFNTAIAEKFKNTDVFSIESGELEPRSKEYCSYIIEAIMTGVPFRFSGNISNRNGSIANLPLDATVEVPVYADKEGFHPYNVGRIPAHLAAMNMSNISVQGLASEAALTGDPELAFWACAMDPLTSTKLTLRDCRRMVAELFEAERKWLPQFEGKTLKAVEDVEIPEGTVGVPVPTDPALAINERFGKLAE
ncbi:MAG: alpha-glucosidase/alpha-galactosidase [Clostridia bacterium]|nr:alpha-glucosidase/alpha-galactosidase [Clostridia bacterium]